MDREHEIENRVMFLHYSLQEAISKKNLFYIN
jgi:hypothetical protein